MTPRGWEFWRSVLAQALGTVLGGSALALIGILVGAIQNVSLSTVTAVAAALGLIVTVAQIAITGLDTRETLATRRKRRRDLERLADQYTQEEVQQKGVWLFLDDVEREDLRQIYARMRGDG